MILQPSTYTFRIDEKGLLWAITASVMLHLLIVLVVPEFHFENEKEEPQILKIELRKPTPPAPAVAEPPLPLDTPTPPKPKPVKKKPKPIIQPKAVEQLAPPVEQSEVTPPVINDIIAVAPTVERTPELVTPVQPVKIESPPPPPPPGPSQADIDHARNVYGNLLGRTIAKYKSYPKIAERRGWEGTTLLALSIDSNGNVTSATISQSSGYDALDNRALEMVKKASPFPPPPRLLQGRTFNISVPVAFKLANG